MRWTPGVLVVAALSACEPAASGVADSVTLTLRLTLAGNRDVGPTPGRVLVFTDSVPVFRAWAFPWNGEACVLASTPVSICTFQVPGGRPASLVVEEPDPAIVVRFAPAASSDTTRDGRYVEFTGWTECPQRLERGLCVVRPATDMTVEGNFQLLQQVSVYQTGAARMDYAVFSAAPTLKVPGENYNVLDFAGCRRILTAPHTPCDSVRLVGDRPFHRFTAYVPRQTIVGMFPVHGAGTEFQRWDGDCILSGIFWPGVCSLISPNTSSAPIILTLRYTWWECSSGVSDRDLGGCVLRGEIPRSRR